MRPRLISELSGLGPLLRLFPDLPMQKRVSVVTPGALPCSFSRVRIALVNHLDDQMAMQAHRWFAIDKLRLLCSLSHDSALPLFL
jgi:hypothetical protein